MSNMVVRTNVFALNAHRNMKNVGVQQREASNRLSSGFRINSAADDAAGLAISEGMRAQIRGLDQASRNAQDAQSMIVTTEGGLEEIGNMLQRVRELLVQSSNDTNTQGQRDMIQQELNQLSQEIGSMQNRVEFNTSRVLAMGPAIDRSITDSISEIVQDGGRVSNAFALVDANRQAVNEARELLATFDATMNFAEMNSRQQNTILRALEGVHFSAFEEGTNNFVPTNIPADINGTTSALLMANATLDDIADLLNAEAAAWTNATTAFRTSGPANLAASVTALDNLFQGAAAVNNTSAMTDTGVSGDAARGQAATALRLALANSLGVSDGAASNAIAGQLASLTNAEVRNLLGSITVDSNHATVGIRGATFADTFIDSVVQALDDYRDFVSARDAHFVALSDLFNAGFHTAGPTAPTAWDTAPSDTNRSDIRDAAAAQLDPTEGGSLAELRNLYQSALNDPNANQATINTARQNLNSHLTTLSTGQRSLTLTGPSVSDLVGMLSNRTSNLLERSEVLNEVRFEMMGSGGAQLGAIRAFAGDNTSGNYVAWYQVGANSNQGIRFDFETVSRTVSSASAVVDVAVALAAMPDSGAGVGRGFDISSLINEVQSSLDDVARIRANLGAVSNRMDFTMRSLDVSSENLADAESRIRNTDVAREMMSFTMANVLQQASVSMLAQANQMPNNLLQLLR